MLYFLFPLVFGGSSRSVLLWLDKVVDALIGIMVEIVFDGNRITAGLGCRRCRLLLLFLVVIVLGNIGAASEKLQLCLVLSGLRQFVLSIRIRLVIDDILGWVF